MLHLEILFISIWFFIYNIQVIETLFDGIKIQSYTMLHSEILFHRIANLVRINAYCNISVQTIAIKLRRVSCIEWFAGLKNWFYFSKLKSSLV